MSLDDYKQYAPSIVRIGISLVFLWFGLNQIFDTASWIYWISPNVANLLPFEPTTIIMASGIFEVTFGTLLILGVFTRIAALLLTIHLVIIAINLGYGDIMIRDLGLAIVTFSIFLHGPDNWCLMKNKTSAI